MASKDTPGKRVPSNEKAPRIVLIAGANGAGKSTSAFFLLKGALGVTEFVNADTIARGLSGFDPQRTAIPAGRILLNRLQQLASARADFGFEATLASRSFAPRIRQLKKDGYQFLLAFLFLPSADIAVARVQERVKAGGHDVPEETIRRRYRRGLRNFFELYRPLADGWWFYDSSAAGCPCLIAMGAAADPGHSTGTSQQPELWRAIREEYE